MEYSAVEAYEKCGGIYTNTSGIVTSPLYPNTYPQMANCVYLISLPNGTYINASFINMDIKCNTFDHIEMRDGLFRDSPLIGRFCGNNAGIPPFVGTTQNHLWIR